MATDTTGDSARLFPWQVSHYIVRGGPNDPVLAATGGPPVTTGGMFSFNSARVFPPIPGTTTNRSMAINTTTGATSGATVITNTGGILIGTLPKGAWITGIQVYVYTTFAGGTNDTVALVSAPANTAYPIATVNIIATMTAFTGGVLYGSPDGSVGVTALASAPGMGPGSGVVAANTLATTDIDLYVLTYKAAGTGTAFTAGAAAIMVAFTGLEG